LDCDTWAELLDRLSQPDRRATFTKQEITDMKRGVTEFIALANRVSKKWQEPPSVLEEFRSSRKHDE
jgi:hypothetical protein